MQPRKLICIFSFLFSQRFGPSWPSSGVTFYAFKCPPHEKDDTNMLLEKTKNSRGKRNQNSGLSGT
jgi:hypothetical protein